MIPRLHSLLCRYREEMQQAKFLFPGSFGTGSKGSRLPTFAPKNAANTNIIPWQGGLLAMFESGQPHHLQSHSLRTQGLNLSAGALKAGLPLQTPFSVVDAAAGKSCFWQPAAAQPARWSAQELCLELAHHVPGACESVASAAAMLDKELSRIRIQLYQACTISASPSLHHHSLTCLAAPCHQPWSWPVLEL